MLRDVVQEDGTGTQARIKGFQVGGKTGTAQKASAKGGYGNTYVASFVGILPASDPEYLIVAVIDEPNPQHYGGVVAAPAVKAVSKELLVWSGLHDTGNAHIRAGSTSDQTALNLEFDAGTSSSGPNLGDEDRVPDLCGVSLRRAVEFLAGQGIMPRIKGEGVVVTRQRPKPRSDMDQAKAKDWTLWLSDANPTEEPS
jgi:cell division protein FtsI (penicillin-binding protein 3)